MNITQYTTFDLPVPYKKLKIYPVTVKDYTIFSTFAQCLTIDKNSIPDPKIISMTNLEYIYYKTMENVTEYPYILWFDRLLSLCLKEDKSFEDMEKSIERYKTNDDTGKPSFFIEDEQYTSDDFEKIKEIIAEQNLVELIDENISKEVRDSLEKARDFKRKLTNRATSSTEDYIVSLSVSTGWSLEYIYSMTIRKFTKCIRRMDNLIHYKIYLAASMSGMVEFKNTDFIIHWLSSLDEDEKYKDVSVDMQDIEDKISFESAKNTS